MTRITRRGLTLVELLASLTLLSFVCAACMAWVTSVSRGSITTLDDRLTASDALRAQSLFEELLLRSTDERSPAIDPQGHLLVPTRWWVTSAGRALDLAVWARFEPVERGGVLAVAFLNESRQPVGPPRPVMGPIHSLEFESQSAPDSIITIDIVIAMTHDRQLTFCLTAEPRP